jgi:YggT family protein
VQRLVIGLPIAAIVNHAFNAYYLIVVIRVVMSWTSSSWRSPTAVTVGRFVYGVTEPLLAPIRRALRPYLGNVPMDISPLVLCMLISVIQQFAVRALLPY